MVAGLFCQSTGLFVHGQGQGFVFGFFFLDQMAELLAAVQLHTGVLQVVP